MHDKNQPAKGEVEAVRVAYVIPCKVCAKVQAVALAENDSEDEYTKVTSWLSDSARRNNTAPQRLADSEEVPKPRDWCACARSSADAIH